MRKLLLTIIALIALIALVPLGFSAAQIGSLQLHPAEPGVAARAALEPGNGVAVTYDDTWLVFAPAGARPATGLVFYPGANCDVRGYAPLLRALAEAGYLAVGIQMPLRLSILHPEAAAALPPAFPQVKRWIAAGHSMGGGSISGYAHDHPERLAGLILLDAYPLERSTLADSPLPVWHVHRARLDGSPPDKLAAMRHRFPAGSIWVPSAGGSHMQFGSFVGGTYEEGWPAQISETDQLRQVEAAVLRAALAIAPPTEEDGPANRVIIPIVRASPSAYCRPGPLRFGAPIDPGADAPVRLAIHAGLAQGNAGECSWQGGSHSARCLLALPTNPPLTPALPIGSGKPT